MKRTVLFFLLPVFFLSMGCSFSKNKNWEEQSGRAVRYKDVHVDLSTLSVLVWPVSGSRSGLTALCFPFFMEQTVAHPHETGRLLGRMFWSRWMEMELFPVMLFSQNRWQGKKKALAEARQKNIDLLVRGQVVHYLTGGASGTTSMGLRVDIYAVESGLLVWSFLQSGRVANTPDRDYIFFRERTRMSEAPEVRVMAALAASMAQRLLKWD